MRDARFQELDRAIAKESRIGALAERVLHNEAARYKGAGVARRGPPDSVFTRSLTQACHPLDRKFRCGFDPHNVSIKTYRVHITNCKDRDCIDRHLRWLDLMEYFR